MPCSGSRKSLFFVPLGTRIILVPNGTVSCGRTCRFTAAYQYWRLTPIPGRKHGYPKNKSDRIGRHRFVAQHWLDTGARKALNGHVVGWWPAIRKLGQRRDDWQLWAEILGPVFAFTERRHSLKCSITHSGLITAIRCARNQ